MPQARSRLITADTLAQAERLRPLQTLAKSLQQSIEPIALMWALLQKQRRHQRLLQENEAHTGNSLRLNQL